MDEKTAWQSFYATGKIEDYIKYSQIKYREEQAAHGVGSMQNLYSPVQEGQRAGKDTGVDYPGADDWRERPSGHRFNA